MTMHQNRIDRIKAAIDSSAPDTPARDLQRAYAALALVERASAYAMLWERVIADDADLDAKLSRRVYGAIDVLHDFMSYMPPPAIEQLRADLDAQPPEVAPIDGLMTVQQAADALGLSLPGLRKYIYASKQLRPAARIGRVLLFAPADVEQLRAQMREPGRPRM